MHWFARIFANALARRAAAVIVAAALAFFGIGSARAQVGGVADFSSEGAAFAACQADTQAELDYRRSIDKTYNYSTYGCRQSSGAGVSQTGNQPYFTCSVYRTYGGTEFYCQRNTKYYYRYPKDQSCSSQPDWNGPYPYLTGGIPKNGSITCNSGCKQVWYSTGDGYFNGKYSSLPGTCSNYDDAKCKAEFGNAFYWNGAMSACESNDGKCKDGSKPNSLGDCKPEPCPEGKVLNPDGTCENKKKECPAGNVKAPSGECLPGDGQCAAGEAKGKDGTCKRDSNGDGKPDSEEGDDDPNKDSASGGENCNAPPSCNGNPIMCLQLRTQWRIDCNTRNDRNVSGGSCSAMPVCVGKDCNAQDHAQLIQGWKAACALEKLASKEGGGDDSGLKEHLTAMKQAEVNALRAMGQDDGHSGVSSDDIWAKKADYGENDLDSGLFGGGGGSCNFSFTIGGHVVSPAPQFWQIVSIIHWLLIASAYLWVASKLG